MDANNAPALYNLGNALYMMNKYEEAVVSYQKALKINIEVWKIILKHLGFNDFQEMYLNDIPDVFDSMIKYKSNSFDGIIYLYTMHSFLRPI